MCVVYFKNNNNNNNINPAYIALNFPDLFTLEKLHVTSLLLCNYRSIPFICPKLPDTILADVDIVLMYQLVPERLHGRIWLLFLCHFLPLLGFARPVSSGVTSCFGVSYLDFIKDKHRLKTQFVSYRVYFKATCLQTRFHHKERNYERNDSNSGTA